MDSPRLAKRDTNRVAQYCREDSVFIVKMEGNLEKDSISEWRKKNGERKREKRKMLAKRNTTWKIEKCLLKRHGKE